jgi:Fe-S-cluster-containing hydrogenase component 2
VAALHPETGTAIICDLCGGDPACVKRCATGAIVYAEGDAGARARREALTLASVAGASLCAEERHGDAAATDVGRRDADV